MNDQDLARALCVQAEDLEHRGYPKAGVSRQGARRLVELSTELEQIRGRSGMSDLCAFCSGPVIQPARGRRRLYCDGICKQAARKARNGTLVT